jgi:hypothetical protein
MRGPQASGPRSMNEVKVIRMKLEIEVAILEICKMADDRGYGWRRRLRVGGSFRIAKRREPAFADKRLTS